MKILIVDDEELVRKTLGRVARSRGHEVTEVEDGLKGVDAWKSFCPNLVFLDVLMPGLSGPQVLKEVKKDDSTKVVLMSAYSGEYNLETAQSIGAELFIQKPFENIFEVMDQAEGLFHG